MNCSRRTLLAAWRAALPACGEVHAAGTVRVDATGTRRAFVAGLAALAASCARRPRPERPAATSIVSEPLAVSAPAATAGVSVLPPTAATRSDPPAPPGITVRTIAFGPARGGPQQAVIVTPSGGAGGARYPLLVALGGLGETRRGLAAGAAGWVKDYWLDRTLKRLAAPPLTPRRLPGPRRPCAPRRDQRLARRAALSRPGHRVPVHPRPLDAA